MKLRNDILMVLEATRQLDAALRAGEAPMRDHVTTVRAERDLLTSELQRLGAEPTPSQGNFVLAVSEGFRDGVHSAFYDLYRISDGRIVEHWDTIEEIPPRDKWMNANGKF